MKRIIATGLLFVFLFNIIGYKAFFYYLETTADKQLESKLAIISNSDENLITIKIPINLPYQTDWDDFERADGEVTVKGTVYKYVKQKIYRDTLILLCINHKEKATIQKSSVDFFKKVNDLSADANKKPTIKTVKNDYLEPTVTVPFNLIASDLNTYTSYKEGLHSSSFVRKAKMPPRAGLPLI